MTSSLTISSLISELVEFRGCCLQEALIPCLAELKLLAIKGGYFNQIISEVSFEPLWLCWSNIGHRDLPPRVSLKNLRVLEISEESREHHFEALWEAESDAPLQLRELVISRCFEFQRLPNSIGCLTELKKIEISRSDNIRSLPESFCRLQQLEHLQLRSCNMLSSLPCRFGDLRNLRYLDLYGCRDLKNLPVSFRNLSLLQHLNLAWCTKLIVEPDDFQNITKLEYLSLDGCRQLEELPRHITNQASLRKLNLSDVKRLREVPIEIGELGRLRKLRIGSNLLISLPNSLGRLSLLTHLRIDGCPKLESLPTSLGDLPSLTSLTIYNCPKLESLPTSLGDLSSLTNLLIHSCPKVTRLPFSVGRLSLLQRLHICECPIIQVDFDVASSSPTISSNLRWVKIERTGVFKISICKDRYPGLERLELFDNDQLTEVEAVPVSLECLSIRGSPKLVVIPSFARLTSLRELHVRDCEKMKGLEHYTGLEELSVETSGEVLGIESLEQMQNLRRLKLRASKASAIVSCIQTIKKWPDQITVCTRAVPDAASLLLDSSILSSNGFVVESLRLKLNRVLPESPCSEEMKSLLNNSSMNGNAMMLCFVINSTHSSQVQIELIQAPAHDSITSMFVSEGRWAVIGVFTASQYIVHIADDRGKALKADEIVEGSLAVGGEEQRLVEAFLPLLQSISN